MTVTLHAQPYDLAARGFYFESYEGFAKKAATAVNDYGDPVEEFEIQFIDGDDIDCELASAIVLYQSNIAQFFDAVADWDTDQKTRVILAVGECGYDFTASTQPDDFDVEIYPVETLRDLAEQFVEEGLFGDIPEPLQFYIDYDAIARDLGMEYSEITIAGERMVFRAA